MNTSGVFAVPPVKLPITVPLNRTFDPDTVINDVGTIASVSVAWPLVLVTVSLPPVKIAVSASLNVAAEKTKTLAAFSVHVTAAPSEPITGASLTLTMGPTEVDASGPSAVALPSV